MSELAEIYRIYFDDVYRYLLALSHDAQLAEELTSETFCRAMRALPGFRGACDIRVWLCQIAKNCFYTEQKRMGRIELLDDGKMEALPASAPSLEEQLTDRDDAARIRAALGGLSFRTIGQLFGKSENWACVTYHRAKTIIRKNMEGST